MIESKSLHRVSDIQLLKHQSERMDRIDTTTQPVFIVSQVYV